jgi:plasmid stabilization system protein ParE
MGGLSGAASAETRRVSFHLVVRPEVDADLLEAEAWYEGQQPGLGRVFLQAVRAAIAKLADDALLYRVRHRRMKVRWVYPRRFPYRIIFRVIGDTVIIYAVLHSARDGRQWQERLLPQSVTSPATAHSQSKRSLELAPVVIGECSGAKTSPSANRSNRRSRKSRQ